MSATTAPGFAMVQKKMTMNNKYGFNTNVSRLVVALFRPSWTRTSTSKQQKGLHAWIRPI